MGLFSKISEQRMKDPVDGTLHVVGISTPDPTATSANYRIDGVVSGPGLPPQAVVHHGMMSLGKWPSPGQDLPVRVDRRNPTHLVIQTDRLSTGRAQEVDAAQALAASMRGETPPAGTAPFGAGPTGAVLAGTGLSPGDLAGILAQAGLTGPGAAGPAGPDPTTAEQQAVPVSNADLLARGVAGHATLLGTFPSPVQSPKPGCTTIGLMLNVLVDGRAPYQVQSLYAVPDAAVSRLAPGTLLTVGVDPVAADLVAVDWDVL